MVDIKPFMQKHLYSARIENHANRMMTVEGTYVPEYPTENEKEEKLIVTIKPGESKTFGARQTGDMKLHLAQFFITDGENEDKTYVGPFVDRDKEREVFVIEKSDVEPFEFHKKQAQ
jgi:hypothetical protein